MDSADAIFTDYYIWKKDNRLTFRGELKHDGLVTAGLHLLTIICFAVMFNIAFFGYFLDLRFENKSFNIIYVMLMYIFLVGTYILIFTLVKKAVSRLFAVSFLEVKNENIKFCLEKMSINKSDIQSIKIIEESIGAGSRQYRLILDLPDGEVNSKFAFTSYDKAQAIIELIKNSS